MENKNPEDYPRDPNYRPEFTDNPENQWIPRNDLFSQSSQNPQTPFGNPDHIPHSASPGVADTGAAYGAPPAGPGGTPHGYGQPTPGYGQPTPGYGQGAPGYGAAPMYPGMAVDMRPGIIPLRPLRFAEFFDGGFRAIRFNVPAMLGSAAIISGILLIINIISSLPFPVAGLTEALSNADSRGPSDSEIIFGILASVIPYFFTVVGTILLPGILITAVIDAVRGRRSTLKEVWTVAQGRIFGLIGFTLLLSIAMAIVVAALVIPVVFLIGWILGGTFGSSDVTASSVLLAFGLVAVVVLASALVLFAVNIYTLAAPAIIVVERAGIFAAIRRSFQLTRRLFWRNTGVNVVSYMLVGTMGSVIAGILIAILSVLAASAGFFETDAQITQTMTIVGAVVQALVQVIFTPFTAAITTLLYVDMRMRKEGLDLALQQEAMGQ